LTQKGGVWRGTLHRCIPVAIAFRSSGGPSMTRRRGLLASMLLGASLAGVAAPMPARAQGGDVVVFAAASLKNALDAINAQWQKETGKKAVISYAASSALAKQIERGAPAQVFIS